jgi:hypothetical protein
MELLDDDGYPTEEYLQYIREWTHEKESIMSFLKTLEGVWYYGLTAFQLSKPYKKKRKLVLHTIGWSGNEDIIHAILSNMYLQHFSMKYVMWKTGGHYYFEIPIQ